MVSVLIPAAIWQQLGNGAAPVAWRGASVEVQSLPRLDHGKYINLPIGDAAQLRVIAAPAL